MTNTTSDLTITDPYGSAFTMTASPTGVVTVDAVAALEVAGRPSRILIASEDLKRIHRWAAAVRCDQLRPDRPLHPLTNTFANPGMTGLYADQLRTISDRLYRLEALESQIGARP